MEKKTKKLSIYGTCLIIFAAVIVASLILSYITSFCDFYADHLFSIGLETYGRVTGIFPFSAGEILIVLAILLLILQILFSLFLIPFHRKKRYRIVVTRYSKFMLAFVLLAVWLMTTNCSTLYHCSKLEVGGKAKEKYSTEEIRKLRDFIVEKCNTLSAKMNRDENGDVQTTGDINGEIRKAMKKLSSKYPRLSGYYPNAKPMLGSFFMYQAGYDGVYFPFSLEANYNTYISDIRYPHVICHELAHLKGYIYEDEADFIAYLACVGSDDEQLQYAGYLGVLDYIDSDYWQSVQEEDDQYHLEIADCVYRDSSSYTFSTTETLTTMPEIIDSELVETASESFTDAYLEYYDAEPNYAEVTKLLLAYYDGALQ